ncbi:tetratricopeptide repeat-containing sensor histidine kinase [Mucilaginibacter agri]|uniref:histidine kinase n=1 Tax=Mucilaginibacter agri TaxID=2695265 RepID=A0A965ZJL6_9SPHI|nr:tetratricopeptide repeat protein [Mucilaginibacter agri]NCD72345.1 tetratricopeptide repeat protein [Mucilaginibacter agri]
MIRKFAFFLLVLFVNTVSAQKPDDKNNIAKYEQLIKHYRYLKPDSAKYFCKQALILARSKGDSAGVAKILLQKGMIDDNDGRFDDSEAEYQHSLEIFRALDSKKDIASTLIRLGVVKLRNGNYDKAIDDFLNALRNSELVKDKYGMMEANYSISWAYLDQHKDQPALQYLITAEGFNQQLPFSNISLNIYNHFGVVYTRLNDFKKAEYYLKKGLELSQKPEYQGLNINLLNNLAGVYARQGQIAKAVKFQELALARSKAIGNYLRELQSLLALSKTYTKTNPDKAIYYLTEAVLLARAQKIPKQEIRFLEYLSELYKSQGNYKMALETKDRQYALADSFFFKKMSQNIETLKGKYELSKSKARIKELDYLNNKRKMQLKTSVLYRNITLAGVAVLLVILILLYNQYKLKNKNNKEINSKNRSLNRLLEEKEWLVKEIHHRVKNNLQIVVSLLNTQARHLSNKEAIDAIDESAHRMQAMSIIHQKLYKTEGVSTVNVQDYLEELTAYLKDSVVKDKDIRFIKSFDGLTLDISQAIPIGLIVNEAVTNAVKHAFTEGGNNAINIVLTNGDKQKVILEIYDNGKGLPADFSLKNSESMGMMLMKGLAKQIDASLMIESRVGTYIKVEFISEIIPRVIFESGISEELLQ